MVHLPLVVQFVLKPPLLLRSVVARLHTHEYAWLILSPTLLFTHLVPTSVGTKYTRTQYKPRTSEFTGVKGSERKVCVCVCVCVCVLSRTQMAHPSIPLKHPHTHAYKHTTTHKIAYAYTYTQTQAPFGLISIIDSSRLESFLAHSLCVNLLAHSDTRISPLTHPMIQFVMSIHDPASLMSKDTHWCAQTSLYPFIAFTQLFNFRLQMY